MLSQRHSIKVSILIAISASLLFVNTASAQDLGYDSGSDGSDGAFSIFAPFHAGLQGMVTAYDPIRQKLVFFGGALEDRNESIALDRMWTWDGNSFEEIGLPVMPPARHSAVMVWDSSRNEIVLFGGRDGGTLYNDTWVWDGQSWAERSPENSPPARWNHGGAFDAARGELVIFGGGIGSPVSADTWVWNGSDWSQREPSNPPSLRFQHAMAYDAARQKVVMFGGRAGQSILDQTWTWDGTDWRDESPAVSPPSLVGATLTFDRLLNRIVLFGGATLHRGDRVVGDVWSWDGSQWMKQSYELQPQERFFHSAAYVPNRGIAIFGGENSDVNLNDLWLLNGAAWEQETGSDFVFDMRGRESGIWQFTSINVPSGVSVRFHSNASNTPVVWLASEAVVIDGDLNLDGSDGTANSVDSEGAMPGPGGFRGGIGGGAQAETGSFTGQPGLGPGGGAPGMVRNGSAAHGQFEGVYGNLLIDPLIGGSGGGGGGGDESRLGSSGGAGGGALFVASSRDLLLNGSIFSRGGGSATNNGDGGHGSGGAVVLVADRLLGSGSIDVTSELGGAGRVRLEGFERPLASGSVTTPIVGPPFAARNIQNQPELIITRVAGLEIPDSPLGDFKTPDVSLSSEGAVNVLVSARNVPDGVGVQLRITSPEGVVVFPGEGEPEVILNNGQVQFSVVLPAGAGALQATAEF